MDEVNASNDISDVFRDTIIEEELPRTHQSSTPLASIIQEEIGRAFRNQLHMQPTATKTNVDKPCPSEISRVAVKVAPLNSQDPRLWLKIIEAQFEIAKITNESTKYYHLLSALNDRVLNDLSDLILAPLSNTPFSDIKHAILERLCDSKNMRLQQLLQRMELGDMKPSQLYRKLKVHGGADITDDLLKTIWLKRLPVRTQEVLATVSDTLSTDKLADLADRIHETATPAQVMAVSKPSDTTPAPHTTETSIVTAQIGELIKRLDRMEGLQDARTRQHAVQRSHSPNFRRKQWESSSHPNTNPNTSSVPQPCYFHKRFQDAARNCKPGCVNWEIFKSKN